MDPEFIPLNEGIESPFYLTPTNDKSLDDIATTYRKEVIASFQQGLSDSTKIRQASVENRVQNAGFNYFSNQKVARDPLIFLPLDVVCLSKGDNSHLVNRALWHRLTKIARARNQVVLRQLEVERQARLLLESWDHAKVKFDYLILKLKMLNNNGL